MVYGTQSLHRLVQRAPDALASIDGARRRDWAEVATAARAFAGALVRSGVRPGDRVALLASNGDIHLDYVLGVFWAGAVINPVNTRWSPLEIAFSLEDCQTRLLIVEDRFSALIPAIREAAPGLDVVVQRGGAPGGDILAFERWIADAHGPEDVRASGETLAAILYTGGTTGRPKGVMLSHVNLLSSANGYLAFPGARPGARYLHVAPLFHIGALSGMFTSLMAGSTQVFLPAFDPARVIETVGAEQVSDVFLVPSMLRAILSDPGFAPGLLNSLERIVYGGSSIDDALLDQAMTLLPGAAFVQAYGMTELSPIATLLGPDDHSEAARRQGRGRSAGRATTSTEVRIVDPHGQEVPRGDRGEVVAKGGGVMLGYWGLPDQTSAALRDGWMHTGDVGWMDDQGYVTVVDRLKDMIVTGGENVYSAEVENALTAHPDVIQAAVIGLPDDRWGERVHAVVVLQPGAVATAETLRQHCRRLIAGYKIPKTVAVVDALPLSTAGKVLKTELRARYAACQTTPDPFT
jgi:acyl-CoA synthetase (AMP-forming)/AMP-acid ligase II